MKQSRSNLSRAGRFLRKRVRNKQKGWDYSDAPDPRQQTKVTHKRDAILWSLELGLVSNQPTLRDVEELMENAASWTKPLVSEWVSDTTLDTEARRLDVDYLRKKLIARVRDLHRSKMLAPVGVPCGIVTVDGKNLATLNHDAAGTGHARSIDNEKWHRSKEEEAKHGRNYYLMPALRATLTSSEAKVCIDQLALPPGTGESTSFTDFVDNMHTAYGRSGMFEVIDADAGLISLRNATAVNNLGYGYIFGLKGNQADLFAEAKRLLEPKAARTTPEAETPWERRNGHKIRRRLWRIKEMAGIENSVGTWSHLRQTWLVRQETLYANGHVENEDLYFVTSLPWNTFSPQKILLAVRNHWGVENDANNSLDLQWREDSGPWCTQGTAVWTLGLLRLMAYNTAQILRRRRLRKKDEYGKWLAPMSWRSLFKIIDNALTFEIELAPLG